MDARLVGKMVVDKLSERDTYTIAAVVGILITLYGQLLVPWLRNIDDPIHTVAAELEARPALTVFSIFLAFAFPFCVGIISSVMTRYRNRRVESMSDFPERKPDPVFRANHDGEFVEMGTTTRSLFENHGVQSAQMILGVDTWQRIVAHEGSGWGLCVFFEMEGARYLVSHARTEVGDVNVYMARQADTGNSGETR